MYMCSMLEMAAIRCYQVDQIQMSLDQSLERAAGTLASGTSTSSLARIYKDMRKMLPNVQMQMHLCLSHSRILHWPFGRDAPHLLQLKKHGKFRS